MVAEDCLVGLLVLRLEGEEIGACSAGASPEAHRLTIRAHLGLQPMRMWHNRHLILILGNHIKRRRDIHRQYMLALNIIGPDHIDRHILQHTEGRPWERWDKLAIHFARVGEYLCLVKFWRQELMVGSHH